MYTLRDAKKELERIENDIEKLLKDKEAKFSKTQPQAVDTSAIRTDSSTRADKFLVYSSYAIDKEIDDQLDILYAKRSNWLDWVDKELKILGKYNDLQQQVIYYKDDYLPRNSFEKTWCFIANKVHASESTCKRIYRKYKNQRNIES